MPSEVEIQTPETEYDGGDEVVRWRRARLVGAGYDEESARKLAAARDVDLHEAVALLHRGCPPDVAAKILL